MMPNLSHCPVCGSVDTEIILKNRPDYEFDVKYNLTYLKCLNNKCGLVFVNTVPDAKEVAGFYKSYSTHVSNIQLKYYSLLARINKSIYLRNVRSLLHEEKLTEPRILDYGCGNGNFLQDLDSLGWQHVTGYDFDSVATNHACQQGLRAFSNFDQVVQQGPFDFIFLNHVIEHLITPIDDIEKLAVLLNKKGRIIIRTPNNESFLRGLFKENWRGWETPRHLQVFNTKSIKVLSDKIDNLKLHSISTSNLMFTGIFNESFHSSFYRHTVAGKVLRKLMTTICYPVSLAINLLAENKGEELCAIFEKK